MDNKRRVNKKSSEFKPMYYLVPSEIMDLPGLSIGYLKVYCSVIQFWNSSRPCFLSEAILCEKSNLGRTQVYEALKFFEKHNIMKRIIIDGKKHIINPNIMGTDLTLCSEILSGKPDDDVRKTGHDTSGKPDYNNININIKTNLKEKDKKEKENPPAFAVGPFDAHQQQQEIAVQEEQPSKITPKTKSLTMKEFLDNNPYSIPEDLIREWIDMRKRKGASTTLRVWNMLHKELTKVSNPIAAMEECLFRGWIGFKAEWVNKTSSKEAALDHHRGGWKKSTNIFDNL